MESEFATVLFFLGVSLTANVGLLIAALRSGLRLRQLERNGLLPSRPSDEHVERLEQVVDALTSQVDQLASSQEFLNRLVTDRFEKLVQPLPPPQPDTPPR